LFILTCPAELKTEESFTLFCLVGDVTLIEIKRLEVTIVRAFNDQWRD